jgi:adenine phosphoribosyltransferase
MPTADFKKLITTYLDFNMTGVFFREISPLLYDITARNEIVAKFKDFIATNQITVIAGIDARGFVLGSMLAERYQLPFVMLRKKGKLPSSAIFEVAYKTEYSTDALTIRKDILQPTDSVLIIDDVLATGGTLLASVELVRQCGVTAIALGVIVELLPLG